MTRLAVTGAGGFIGRQFVNSTRAKGIASVPLGRAELDALLEHRIAGCDAIVHLAAHTVFARAHRGHRLTRALDHHRGEIRRGHAARTQAQRPLDQNYRLYVAFLDAAGKVLHDNAFYQPASVLWYPTALWEPGQPVFVRTLPWTLSEDRFTLAVGVYAGDGAWQDGSHLPVRGDPGLPVQDGSLVRLGGFSRTASGEWVALPAVPETLATLPDHTVDAAFGDSSLRLVQAALPASARRGDTLALHLTWHREAAETDYSRFVHVLDAEGNKIAQADGTIADALGALPISSWPVGQPVDDVVALALPPDLAPGTYSVVSGLYDWQTGTRLAATGSSATPDGAVLLGTVNVEP